MHEKNSWPIGKGDRKRPAYSLHEKIDICRGLFAFLVVSAHSLELAWVLDPIGMHRLRPWLASVLTHGLGTGLYYVMGFFVISGYCIQLSVMRLSASTGFSIKIYTLARISRVFPLYYLALFTTLIIERLVASIRVPVWGNGLNAGTLINQIFVLQDFTQTYGSFAPSWSITNEVAYYILFGLLVALLARSSLRPAQLGMYLCVVIGAVSLVIYRCAWQSRIVLSTGLLFGLGVNWFLGALIATHGKEMIRVPIVRIVAPLWPVVFLITVTLWCSQRVNLEFIYLGSGLAFTLLLLRFLQCEAMGGSQSQHNQRSLPVFLGLASYPTYLFHGPLLLLFGSLIKRLDATPSWWTVWVLGAGVAIMFGLLLGYLAERPFMAYRARYLRHMSQSRSRSPQRQGFTCVGIQQSSI